MTETEAYEAMLGHHALLGEQLEDRVQAVRKAVDQALAEHPERTGYEPAVAELVAFVGEEVLPHALAEEQTVYRAAAARVELKPIVDRMVDEHKALAALADELAAAESGSVAVAKSDEIAQLFIVHVGKENDVLLPPLLADDDVDLAALLVQLHRQTETAQGSPHADEGRPALHSEDVLLSLLLEAANDLARAGQADRACRLAAAAWSALRARRPDLAVRITAALHRLARMATAEPVAFRGETVGRGHGADPDLDVRAFAPAKRHEMIFVAYEHLAPGAGFVLVNDHDPKPLRYQFEAEHAGQFTWEVLEAGPEVWRARIGRPMIDGADERNDPGAEYEPLLDVRPLAHGQRHEAIFTAYSALSSAEGFVLVNDHDPKPLRYQFEAQYPGQFTWDYLEAGPRTWRVRIGRVLETSR